MALNKKYFVVRNALFSYSSILMKNSEDQDLFGKWESTYYDDQSNIVMRHHS